MRLRLSRRLRQLRQPSRCKESYAVRCRPETERPNSSIIARLNAGMSSGLRLDTRSLL